MPERSESRRHDSGARSRAEDEDLLATTLTHRRQSEAEESSVRRTVPCGIEVARMRPVLDTERVSVVPEPVNGSLGTLTVVRGADVGRTFALDGDAAVIGRAPTCEIWVDDACVSREHARVVRGEDGAYHLEDLGSTNGTFIGNHRLDQSEPLTQGARVQIGPSVLMRFTLVDPRDEIVQRDLFHAATRDPLTGAYNRRYFEERLEIEIARSRRAHIPLALLLLDVDGLKEVNDLHGHLAGDGVLRAIAALLAHHVRMADVLARWGGDEFVLIAPGGDRAEAEHLAERLRASVASLAINGPGAQLRVTLSVGIAVLDELAIDVAAAELVARADARLYGAKRSGKNRVLAG